MMITTLITANIANIDLVTTLATAGTGGADFERAGWIVAIMIANVLFTILIVVLQMLGRFAANKSRDENARIWEQMRNDNARIWRRLETGESIFENLRGNDADIRVKHEKDRGALMTAMAGEFVTRGEFSQLYDRLIKVELRHTEHLGRLTSSVESIEKLVNGIIDRAGKGVEPA